MNRRVGLSQSRSNKVEVFYSKNFLVLGPRCTGLFGGRQQQTAADSIILSNLLISRGHKSLWIPGSWPPIRYIQWALADTEHAPLIASWRQTCHERLEYHLPNSAHCSNKVWPDSVHSSLTNVSQILHLMSFLIRIDSARWQINFVSSSIRTHRAVHPRSSLADSCWSVHLGW